MKKQQVEQLVHKSFLYTQMSQNADIIEEMLLDDEVIFGEELNRKLTAWLMSTQKICYDLYEMTLKEFEALED